MDKTTRRRLDSVQSPRPSLQPQMISHWQSFDIEPGGGRCGEFARAKGRPIGPFSYSHKDSEFGGAFTVGWKTMCCRSAARGT